MHPKDEPSFIRYFCGNTENPDEIKATEEKRNALYKAVVSLIRAYANIANEMQKADYTIEQADKIKHEVKYYSDLRQTIRQASGDALDFKRFEPGMRQLMDMYLDAKSSKKISYFENQSLVDLIVNVSEPNAEYNKTKSHEAVAETIENNVRKVITEESQTNPKYYEKMSTLLHELVSQRKNETLEYEEYLKKIKQLAEKVSNPAKSTNYPSTLNTLAKIALFDNLENNEVLALALDSVILSNKLDGWRDGGIKEKKLRLAVNSIIKDDERTAELIKIIKAQSEY